MRLNKFIAEDIGVHIGDGSMWIQKAKNKSSSYVVKYVGDKSEDRLYYEDYLPKLLKNAYGLNIAPKPIGTDIGIYISSKQFVDFKHNELGLPLGKKAYTITIPKMLLPFASHVIRGIADTDGTIFFLKKKRVVQYYPQVRIASASVALIKQIKDHLAAQDIPVSVHENIKDGKYTIQILCICGAKNLERWMKVVGFSNPKHLTKYLVWKKFGHCPSYTTLAQRLKMLGLTNNLRDIADAGIRFP